MASIQTHDSASARWAHLCLRLFAGAVICEHGAQKLFGAFGGVDGHGHAVAFALKLSTIAAPLEFLGGLLIMAGLFTSPVAFILSGEMAVAYFLFHSPKGFWPIANHGEVPVLLCFAFLYIASTGAGVFSLDYLRKRNRPSSVMR